MTEKVYKTATELGLTEPEYCALVKVRAALADGSITDNQFNMSDWWEPGEKQCDSIGCIGGWANTFGRADHINMDYTYCRINARSAEERREPESNPEELFYPPYRDWNKIKPRHAIKAIDNFLMTGEPKWQEVMEQVP